MQAGNFPVTNHSRTMEISLSVFYAVVITHVSPLSSGISSESNEEPSHLLAYGCSGSE